MKLREELSTNPIQKIEILRNAEVVTYPFTDFFKGFEQVEAVRRIFGERTEEVLNELRVEFVSGRRGYMGVSDSDGHLIVSVNYLKNGDLNDLYLDIIHELTHVKQFIEGEELFNRRFEYVDRPTEIEAFRNAVEEARNLGMDEKRILEYLRTEWMSEEALHRLVQALNISEK